MDQLGRLPLSVFSIGEYAFQKNVCRRGTGRVLVQSSSQQVPKHWQPQWQWQSLCVLDYDVPFGRGAFRLDQGSTSRAFTGTGRLSSQAGILARTQGGTSHGSAELGTPSASEALSAQADDSECSTSDSEFKFPGKPPPDSEVL
jgi:hypothetical protein